MNATVKPIRLISGSELARKLNRARSTIESRIASGELVADFEIHRANGRREVLFLAQRIQDVKRTILA